MATRRRIRNLRLRIWVRDRGLCVLCGRPLASMAEMTLDHKVPRSKGGLMTYENLQAAHKKCNEIRGNGDPPPLRGIARRKARDEEAARHAAAFARNHRDPMTVTIIDRLASELADRPATVTSTGGEILWLDKDGT